MRSLKAIAALVALLGAPFSSHALLGVSIDDGTTTTVVWDNAAGDTALASGVINYTGSNGNWAFYSTSGAGGTLLPSFSIDLNTFFISSGPATATVMLTETDLFYGATGTAIPILGSIGGTTSGTVGYSLFANDDNTAFGEGSLVFSGTADSPGGTYAFSASGVGSAILSDPFSLTAIATIAHSGSGTTSFDFNADPVPEPGTLALLSLGLLGAGVVSRRRKQS